MSDSIRQALMQDAARLEVTSMTWEQVQQRGMTGKRSSGTRRKVRWSLYSSTAAASMVALVVVSGYVSPAMATALEKIPVVGKLYAFDNPNLNKYAVSGSPSVTDKGITVTVTKAYYDGTQLYIIYKVQVPVGYQPTNGSQVNLPMTKMDINGQPLIGDSIGGDDVVGDGTYRGDFSMNMRSGSFPDNGTLNIPIDKVGSVAGKWNVSVPVSTKRMAQQTHKVPVGHVERTYDDVMMKVIHVMKGPVYTSIALEMTQPIQSDGQVKHSMNVGNFNFGVFSQDHKYLSTQFAKLSPIRRDGNEAVWDYTLEYTNPTTPVTAVTIEPSWLSTLSGSSNVRVPVVNQFPIQIRLDGYGTTDVRSIEFNADNTVVTGKLDTDGLEHPDFWIEDESGKRYKPVNRSIQTDDTFRDVFPAIPQHQNLYLCAARASDIAGEMTVVPQLDITLPQS